MGSVSVEEKYLRSKLYLMSSLFLAPMGAFIVFSYSLLILILFLASYPIVVLIIASITTIVFMSFQLSCNRVLRWLSKKWSFNRFLQLEKVTKYYIIFVEISIVVAILLSYFIEFPSWSTYVYGFLIVVLVLSFPYLEVLTVRGRAIYYLRQFLEDLKEELSNTNFNFLLQTSKSITDFLKNYNMEVNPYSLSLGMSRASLKKRTEKDFAQIVNGLENPNEPKAFNSLLSSIEKFMSIANKSKNKGIVERSYLSFERKMEILRIVAIPLLLALLYLLIPEIIAIIKPSVV